LIYGKQKTQCDIFLELKNLILRIRKMSFQILLEKLMIVYIFIETTHHLIDNTAYNSEVLRQRGRRINPHLSGTIGCISS